MLPRAFFQRDPRTCAAELIGCGLVWNGCAGIIVETEAYSVENDEACHTFSRKGAREFVAAHRPGAAYVYFNYGMHWLLNVLVRHGGEDGFVLIRAVEPVRGIEKMARRRGANRKSKITNPSALCSGPGKLAQALGVTGRDHGLDLCTDDARCFLPRKDPVEVTADVRVGISRAAHLPWRFLLRGSPFVSVRPRHWPGGKR
jgi:DNA-3-methyladenine glycosylase